MVPATERKIRVGLIAIVDGGLPALIVGVPSSFCAPKSGRKIEG
jgi:hypothetical protein